MYFRFQEALVNYGVNQIDIFQTNDCAEKKDISQVTNTIFALGRAVIIFNSIIDNLSNKTVKSLKFTSCSLHVHFTLTGGWTETASLYHPYFTLI